MDNDKKLEDIINFWQKPGFVYPESKPEIPVADQYQDYKQVQDIFEPRTQMYIEREMGFDDGGLATPKRGLVDEPGSYAGEHSFKPLTTATEKAHYERQYGKKYNEDDWRSGNFEKKKEFSSGKKKVKRDAMWKRSDFRKSLKRYLAQEAEFNKLSKRGYISIREINKLLGGKDTQQAIDTLSSGLRNSPWVEEIKGVKNWKKSRLQTELSMIDEGGKVFYKMPDKETLKGLKSYYKNQEYLSDFKYGRIKDPSIKGAKLFYDDETLMKALKDWSGNTREIDQNALKVLNSVFGSDNWAGPNAIKNLGRALSGEIKIEGIKVNKALGKKILDGMSRTANSPYGGSAWDQAAYTYAKDKMDMLFKNKGSKNFRELFDDTEKILKDVLGKKRGKVAIDEVLSLRTGLTNDAQVYSVFSQIINKKINEKFKQTYDANLSKNFIKIRKELAKGEEANLDKIKGWTDQQNVKLAEAQKKYPGVKFANFGKFDYETGKFAPPEETFGRKRFADLPSDIQTRIRKDFGTSGISIDVGGAGTQKEVIGDLSRASKKLSSLKPRQQMELLKKMGYRCKLQEGVGESVACYMKDVEQTKNNLKSRDPQIQFQARQKLKNANKVASAIPEIGKTIRRGVQIGSAAITAPLKALGLTAPIAYAIEAGVEGTIYDYYRGQGYNHDQAWAEMFAPRLAGEAIKGESTKDVPWYGGAEKLIEKETIGKDPAAQKYANLKNEQMGLESELSDLDLQIKAMESDRTPTNPETLKQLKDKFQILNNQYLEIERQLKPGSPLAQAWNIKQEVQDAKMGQRGYEWQKSNWGLGETPMSEKNRLRRLEQKREKERKEYIGEEFDFTTGQWTRKPEWFTPEGGWDTFMMDTNPGISAEDATKLKWHLLMNKGGFDLEDKISAAGGVANMAGGGIAGIRRPHSISPESGPAPQGEGLSYLFNRDREW